MKNLLLFFIAFTFLTSCQKDVSGTYKSLRPHKVFDEELISIDGNKVTMSFHGSAHESFKDTEKGRFYSVTCTFPFVIEYQGDLSKEGDKYTARILNRNVYIDEEEFKISAWYETKLTKDSLIHYYRDYILNTVDEGLDSKRENSDFVGTQFVIQENKLILVGGNEIDDYYIKIVE